MDRNCTDIAALVAEIIFYLTTDENWLLKVSALPFTHDIIDNIHYSKIKLFTDDIILYKEVSSVNDVNRLQNDLQSLQHWEETWLLKFNISKC